MGTVYVVQQHTKYNEEDGSLTPKFDLSPAKSYGQLVYLLSPHTRLGRPAECIKELQEKLSNFSDDDHLLLIGNPCFIGWATAVAARNNGGKVSLLQWSGKRKCYYEVRAEGL